MSLLEMITKELLLALEQSEIQTNPLIENVLLVDGLKQNLLSISQLCDKNFRIVFEKHACIIYDSDMSTILFRGFRRSNIYILCMNVTTSLTTV